MSIKMLWGFGGVKFAQGAYEKTFLNGAGTLGFAEEKYVWQAKNGTDIIRHRGYRAKIKVRLLNMGYAANTAAELSGLINMLMNSRSTGITIYPRYGTSFGVDIGYLCRLTSDIDPKDISEKVAAGQVLELEFRGMKILPAMPTAYSDPETVNMVSSGGNMVNDAGFNIIARF